MAKAVVKIINMLTRVRRVRCRPDQILVLLPSCLQFSECRQKVSVDVMAECKRCGRCKIKDILDLVDKYGCQCMVATGGRLALKRAKGADVAAVVAIACEKELHEGMMATFPKPALGVINLRPNGPCRDTDVDVAAVEDAIRSFLGHSESEDS